MCPGVEPGSCGRLGTTRLVPSGCTILHPHQRCICVLTSSPSWLVMSSTFCVLISHLFIFLSALLRLSVCVSRARRLAFFLLWTVAQCLPPHCPPAVSLGTRMGARCLGSKLSHHVLLAWISVPSSVKCGHLHSLPVRAVGGLSMSARQAPRALGADGPGGDGGRLPDLPMLDLATCGLSLPGSGLRAPLPLGNGGGDAFIGSSCPVCQ